MRFAKLVDSTLSLGLLPAAAPTSLLGPIDADVNAVVHVDGLHPRDSAPTTKSGRSGIGRGGGRGGGHGGQGEMSVSVRLGRQGRGVMAANRPEPRPGRRQRYLRT